tara:strand:- start:3771 stop:4964 length:1194 start_codon:yes stop_codon:yes gene_type:complete
MSIKDTVLKSSPDLTQIIRKAVDRIGENHALARDNKGVTYSATEIEEDRKEWRKSKVIEESLKVAADEMAEKMILENTIDNMVKESLQGPTAIGNKLKSIGAGFVDKQGTSDTLSKFNKRQEVGEQDTKDMPTVYVPEVKICWSKSKNMVVDCEDDEENMPTVTLDEINICWDKKKDVRIDCESETTLDESTTNIIKKLVNKKLKNKIKIAEAIGGSKVPGLDQYQKAVKKSKGFNEKAMKDTATKFKKYADFEGNSHPEFPHQENSKTDYDSPMYRGTSEDDEFVEDFAYPGLQNFDIHNMNMEKLTDYLEGSSETGNAQEDEDGETLGNVVKSELGKKLQKSAKRRKEKIAANKASMTNLRGYTPDVQKVKQVKEEINTDIADMKKLWSYNKNTQ